MTEGGYDTLARLAELQSKLADLHGKLVGGVQSGEPERESRAPGLPETIYASRENGLARALAGASSSARSAGEAPALGAAPAPPIAFAPERQPPTQQEASAGATWGSNPPPAVPGVNLPPAASTAASTAGGSGDELRQARQDLEAALARVWRALDAAAGGAGAPASAETTWEPASRAMPGMAEPAPAQPAGAQWGAAQPHVGAAVPEPAAWPTTAQPGDWPTTAQPGAMPGPPATIAVPPPHGPVVGAPPSHDQVFAGAAVVNAGPFDDITSLNAFQQSLDRVPQVDDIYVRGFEANRALIDVHVTSPIPLARAMRSVLPRFCSVVEDGPGRVLVNVLASGQGPPGH